MRMAAEDARKRFLRAGTGVSVRRPAGSTSGDMLGRTTLVLGTDCSGADAPAGRGDLHGGEQQQPRPHTRGVTRGLGRTRAARRAKGGGRRLGEAPSNAAPYRGSGGCLTGPPRHWGNPPRWRLPGGWNAPCQASTHGRSPVGVAPHAHPRRAVCGVLVAPRGPAELLHRREAAVQHHELTQHPTHEGGGPLALRGAPQRHE